MHYPRLLRHSRCSAAEVYSVALHDPIFVIPDAAQRKSGIFANRYEYYEDSCLRRNDVLKAQKLRFKGTEMTLRKRRNDFLKAFSLILSLQE